MRHQSRNVVRPELGYVMAGAGIGRSNLPHRGISRFGSGKNRGNGMRVTVSILDSR